MLAQVFGCLHEDDKGHILDPAMPLRHDSSAPHGPLRPRARRNAGGDKANDVRVVETAKQLDFALKPLTATLPQLKLKFDCVTVA